VEHVVRFAAGHRLLAFGQVGVGHHLELAAQDLVVEAERLGALAAAEEQVGVEAHRCPPIRLV
jgi:hypothetical protein